MTQLNEQPPTPSRLWVVRGGPKGKVEKFCLDEGYCGIGWSDLGDLSVLGDAGIDHELDVKYGDGPRANAIGAWRISIKNFMAIGPGDTILMPLKLNKGYVAVGTALSAYEYHSDFPEGARHVHKVNWLDPQVPRDLFGDLTKGGMDRPPAVIALSASPELVSEMLASGNPIQLANKTPKQPSEVPGFLFQANPKIWDLRAALQTRPTFTYSVRQSAKQLWVGAPVFLWESGPSGGVLAQAEVLTEPTPLPPESDRYWSSDAFTGEVELRVWLRVRSVFDPPIARAEVQGHDVLSTLGVLRFANATNYSLTKEEFTALGEFVRGRPMRVVEPEQLFFITAANAAALHHLQVSLVQGVEVGVFESLTEVMPLLRRHQQGGKVFAWGARPRQAAELKWQRLNPGDVMLVYSDSKFVLSGRVYAKARSQEIAERVWGNEGDQTWECIFFLTDLVRLDASRAKVVEELGYSAAYIPQGFEIPATPTQVALRSRYTVLDHFIGALRNQDPPPPPVRVVAVAELTVPDVTKRADEKHLRLEPATYAAVVAALNSGKHVVFTGPPGTAKTTLAQVVANAARDAGLCSGYVLTTATADWTTYETIGGLRPQPDGTLEFEEGHFLASIRENRWLVIDELNRSNFDRAFGQLFTALSGQPVVLPYERAGFAGRPLTIVPPGEVSPIGNADVLAMPAGWRIIATMNVFDKSLLFEMSYALMRRFAFVEVPSPTDPVFEELVEHATPSEYASSLAKKLLTVRKVKDIGPAVFMDIARYLTARKATGVPATDAESIFEAFYSYLLPQFEGLNDEQGAALFKRLRPLLGTALRPRLIGTLNTVLGLELNDGPPEADADEEDFIDAEAEASADDEGFIDAEAEAADGEEPLDPSDLAAPP